MSPILVRPVREQLEHDRVIRLLQAKNRRRYEAGINPGAEQNVAGRQRAVGPVSRRRPPIDRTRPSAAGGRRGRDRRIGQSPGSARAVGAFCQAAGSVSPVRAGRHGRRRPAALRGQPDSRHRDLELPLHRRSGSLHAGPSQPRGAGRAVAQAPGARRPRRHADAKPPSRTAKACGARRAEARQEAGAAAEAPISNGPRATRGLPEVFARQTRVRELLSRCSRRLAARRGRACCTGFARRRTSKSAARRSIPRSAARSRRRIPTSRSIGTAIVETPIPPPPNRAMAGAAARGARHAGGVEAEDGRATSAERSTGRARDESSL